MSGDDRRVTLVSHGPNCLDGLTCAVVASRFFTGRRFEPIFASNREIDHVLRQYDPTFPGNEELWITDISWRDSATDIHLESLVSRGLKLFLVDHHRTAIERRAAGHLAAPFTDFVLDETYAASRLLFEYLSATTACGPGDRKALESARALVMLADDVDRWILDIDGSRRLALIVRAMDQQDAFRSLLAMGSDAKMGPALEQAAARLDAELASTIAVAERSKRVFEVASRGVTLVVAECDGYAGEIADRWNSDHQHTVYALYDHRSGGISLRRTPDCDVDLSRLAAAFGGGGHPAASGCPLPALGKSPGASIGRAFLDSLERGADR